MKSQLKSLIKWSKSEYSHLPWRKKRTLYTTLVSEIMLQQTTVSTVINHYEKFLRQFPSLESLANATEDELTIAWKGLGYYRRARNLKKAAEFIVSVHRGKFPTTREELVKIPGIGDYTAGALMAIGRNKDAIALDANLERVISRLFLIKVEKGPKLLRELYSLYERGIIKLGIDEFGGRDINEALMDCGRVYCKANKVYCELCPLSPVCRSFKAKRQLEIPFKKEIKKQKYYYLNLLRVVVIKRGKVLAYKKSKKEWLSGQWEVPTYVTYSEDQTFKQYPMINYDNIKELPSIKTSITKYKITNHILVKNESQFNEEFKNIKLEWVSIKDGNLSTASLKVIKESNAKY